MSRREEILDPEVARDLAELEAALAGEPGADPELALLVSDVRAEAPRMSAPFALALDERVSQGFPRAAGRRVRVGAWLAGLREQRRAGLSPVLGLAATVLVALVVSVAVVTTTGPGGDDGGSALVDRDGPARPQPGDQAEPAPEGGAGSGAGLARDARPTGGDQEAARRSLDAAQRAVPAPSVVGGAANRKVEKFTQLTLTASTGEVQEVSNGVVRVTQALDGFVEASQITTTDTRGTATFRLRVPVKRLDEAVRRLSALADVGSLSQSEVDITREHVSAAERLSDARAERRALLRALGQATTANHIASLRARLRINRSEIARYKGQLRSVSRRANLATLEVTVDGRGEEKGTADGAWTPRDALRDALRVLEVAAGILVVATAVLVPIALLAVPAAMAARALRRRRREEALDAAA